MMAFLTTARRLPSGPTLVLTDKAVEHVTFSPTTASAAIRFNRNGTITITSGTLSSGTISGEWTPDTAADVGDDVEIRQVNGNFNGPSGWVSLNTDRLYFINDTSGSSQQETDTIELRPVGGSVGTSAVITLTAFMFTGP